MDGSAHCCSSRSPWWVRDSYGRKRLSSLPAAPQWVRRHASGGFAAGPRPSSGCCLPLRSSWNRSPNRDCWKYWSTGQEVHIGSITPGADWRARRTGERLSAAELEKKAGPCAVPHFATRCSPFLTPVVDQCEDTFGLQNETGFGLAHSFLSLGGSQKRAPFFKAATQKIQKTNREKCPPGSSSPHSGVTLDRRQRRGSG